MTAQRRDIEERTFKFAVRVVKLVSMIPKTVEGSVLGRQLLRAGTGVGANVQEAQGASTRKEFIRRMNIARAEARESLYWLRLIEASNILAQLVLRDLVTEANELVSILTAIVKRSQEK